MRVQSPVGEFPVKIVSVRLDRGRPELHVAMGAWRSKVSLERADVPLVGSILLLLAAIFVAGGRLSNHSNK